MRSPFHSPAIAATGKRPIALLSVLAVGATVVVSLANSSTVAKAAEPGIREVTTATIALNQPSDAGLGRLRPEADADTKGMFGPSISWPVIPIHAALAPNGHLVTYGTPANKAQQGGVAYADYNPARGTDTAGLTVASSMMPYDSFCNNTTLLANGTMLMVGGNGSGGVSNMSMTYDPVAKTEKMAPNLNGQRWYATALRRPDDSVLVLGGGDYYAYGAYLNPQNNSVVRATPEIGDGTSAWRSLTGATSTTAFGAFDNRWWYPRAYNANDGSVFGYSSSQMWRMTTGGNGAISMTGTLPVSPGVSGASVMYEPDKILVAGGGEVANGTRTSATNAATLIDITNPSAPKTTQLAAMNSKRQWNNASVLPTGEVFVNGGTIVGTDGGDANSSATSEIWNPTTRTWRTGDTAAFIRTYHSTASLMPSGVVMTGGGGVPGPQDNFNMETYYPSALFTRDASGAVVWASRPAITSIAGNLSWGGTVTLGASDSRAISSVSLISVPSVTHSENTDQRRVPLTFTQSGSSLSVKLPTNKNTLPSGSYLLSVVDSKGVPSASQIVTLRNGAAGQVTVVEADQSAGHEGEPGGSVVGTVPLAAGNSVSLQPVSNPGQRVRHQDFVVGIADVEQNPSNLTRLDSSWTVRTGLASNAGVSFESVNFPGFFLRIKDGIGVLEKNDGSAQFAAWSTYVAQQGLMGQNTSFQVYADRNLYLRHQNGKLKAQAFDGTDTMRLDGTFRARDALGPQAGWYSMTNANSALAMSVADTTLGAAARQATVTNRTNQMWQLRDAGSGNYMIVNGASGLVLGIDGMSTNNGGRALVWNDNGTKDHLWKIFPRDGHWVIKNAHSGLVLGVDAMSRDDGTGLVQWDDNGTADHHWDLTWRGGEVADGTYQLVNAKSRQLLDTAGSSTARGAGLVQQRSSGAATQTWKIVAAGNGTYKIVGNSTGLAVAIAGGSMRDGTPAITWTDTAITDQRWRLVPRGAGYVLINANSGRALGVTGASTSPGTALIQWWDNGSADQSWELSRG